MSDYENGTPATSVYQLAREQLQHEQFRWVISGAAGFIGSNLLQTLLELGQQVVGIDNFLTGHRHNLDQVREQVGADAWRDFSLIEGDIRDLQACRSACDRADYVLHQAALGPAARSLAEPLLCHDINVSGYLNLLEAARLAGVRRVVYAASAASYGDHPALPKQEQHIGLALSPYALSKYVDELYAGVYARCYGLECIGLRYFNVFGPRQDASDAHAAVIPQWVAAMLEGRQVVIHGDGESSRDFCFVANIVQANLLAALSCRRAAINQVYNVALNTRTSLNELYLLLLELLAERHPHLHDHRPTYGPFRPGDVRHSQADISKAVQLLGYAPTHDLRRGLRQALRWYEQHLGDDLPQK
ncbi:NAD-dependent epimerase/dehydratase family protein [Duganella sp. FT135W]|uniref:NAD-dependent epimerase/dehydratase family protein n=1 Tax=Duganella flavida TaxID=2692175 RepID=A0A6L8K8A6_9BURK|nr:SDR family oxidoreductase [Duganella flavida]MYM22114.1 NAD-dependent epimerase/dehydratase family protein [Duganella flavida]